MKILSSGEWKLISDTLIWQREQLQKERERIDRLTEAIARKADIPAFMPPGEPPKHIPNVLERSQGWFDKRPIPAPTSIGEKQK